MCVSYERQQSKMSSEMSEQITFSLSRLKRGGTVLSEQQVAAVLSVLRGQDTVVCLPTGHGKSVIFEVVPWCYEMPDGLGEEGKKAVYSVVIVSPLLSLMDKQIQELVERGQSAVRLSSSLPKDVEEAVLSGQVRYIFGSPECFEERKYRDMLLAPVYQTHLKAVFVDEAHCVEMWDGGKEPFRKAYQKLGDLRSFLPSSVPFVALTATAANTTQRHIIDSLGLFNTVTISESPNRNNIIYDVQVASEDVSVSFNWIIEELQSKGKSTQKTIIFCRSIEACAHLYCYFNVTLQVSGYAEGTIGVSTYLFGMYHAKITESQKTTLIDSFSASNGNCRVLFATIAFGMGINIPDIQRVIHYGPSKNIEEYVQESGRGGRDGNQCHAVLYTYPGCTRGHVSEEMKSYCKNTDVCRCHTLFRYFPSTFSGPSTMHACCDICETWCLCACQCQHCTCGGKSPCNTCCMCTTKCSYVAPFPKVLVNKPRVEDTVDDITCLSWNEDESIFQT